MSLDIIKQIFNPNDIVRSFYTLEPLKSTIVDSLFTQKLTRPSPFMTYSSAKQVLRSVPVVKRDGSPVALGNSELNIDMFAPLPIKVFTNVEASELNDLKALMANKASIDAWRTQKIDELRRAIRVTLEGMASTVATTGKISWLVDLKGGSTSTYEIDYGTIPALSGATQFTTDTKISDIYNTLRAMENTINMNGYGGKISFFAGKDVFTMLLNIVENVTTHSLQGAVRVTLEANKLNVGGYEIIALDETYPDPTGKWVQKINPKTLLAVASQVDGYVYYCALDSISANNNPLPLHIVPKVKDDDSGITLIAQTKPVPMRPSTASCIWTAVA